MIIILMGVSGSGKSTLGPLLAARLSLPFKDADNFHPDPNIEKMRSGIALNDIDREPWLEKLNERMKKWNSEGGAVLACSALKRKYRNRLRQGLHSADVLFVFLDGPKNLISQRLEKRQGHYMSPALLDSQFATLEEPENALAVSIEPNPQDIVDKIISKLSAVNSLDLSDKVQ